MLAPAIALLLAILQDPAPQDLRGEIEVRRAACLALSPAGELWLGSKDGGLYVSRDRSRSWSEVETPAHGADEFMHIRFFDAQRAIIAGRIGGRPKQDEILRTEDGGKHWSLAKLPLNVSASDLQVLADGHAWLVSKGKLFASEDFGATWRIAGAPFDAVLGSWSLWFASPDTGVVGAGINGIRLTRDGGGTWETLTTPVDALIPLEEEETRSQGSVSVIDDEGNLEFRDLPPGHQDPVKGVWILGGKLLALQRNQLFQHPLAPEGAWSPVEWEGQPFVAGEMVAGGLLAVTADQHAVLISEALEMRPLAPEPLDQVPLAMAQDGRGSAFLLARGRVCLVEEQRIQCSGLYSAGPKHTWPIASFDRTRGGTLYGTSSTALYRSRDSGQTWDRLAEQDHLGAVLAFEDGSGAVVATEEGLSAWTEERPVLVPVLERGASAKRAAKLSYGSPPPQAIRARKGNLWIATSFDTDGDPDAERMLRSFDTVLQGPHFTALVYASADEGRSWKPVDRYPGAIVHALWLGSDDVVSMCMSDGVIRAGKLDAATGEAGPEGFRNLSSPGLGLGGQWGSWLAFPSASEGWAGGGIYFGDPVQHRTADGGRTWQAIEAAPRQVTEAYRLGGGACVRVIGSWDEESRVEAWSEGAFRKLRWFDSGVNDARVDATGCLLLRFEHGEVWSLSADAEVWTQLRRIPLPPE